MVRAPAAPAPNSIAVLYFANSSPDTSDAYLADGLTEELINTLGRNPRLVVKPQYSVRRYRGASTADPITLARALNVSHLLTGSVRRWGATHVRVTVELIQARTGTRMWGESFDIATTDPLELQQQIAIAVTGTLAGQLSGAERTAFALFPTKSRQAYDHFLRGNYYMSQRATGVAMALFQFDSAFHLDSMFTRAGARLAYVSALALEWDDLMHIPRDTLLQRGLRLSSNMIRRDPMNSDAWLARGYLLRFANPTTYRGVRESLQRAVQVDSNNAEAWHQYGSILYELGDDTASTAAFRMALTIEPDREMTLLGHPTFRRSGRLSRSRSPAGPQSPSLGSANARFNQQTCGCSQAIPPEPTDVEAAFAIAGPKSGTAEPDDCNDRVRGFTR
jgi:adenylate cyclase